MLYFDHNATTPLAPEVADAYLAALREVPGNASSTHRFGQWARQRLESARLETAGALGCSAAELVYTSGGTEANNLAILGLARNLTGDRKHIVATTIEHPAVLEPLRQLEREGLAVTFVEPSFEAIERALRPQTVLVSMMHANNETGALQPIREIASLIRERRSAGQEIYLHCDGVQALGKTEVDLASFGVDLYAMSAHKVYGPKGIGLLFVRKGTPLRGIQFGGRHERERRAGTENVPGAIAFAKAVELLPRRSTAELAALRDSFERRVLGALEAVEVNGPLENRIPNTSNLLFRGVSGEVLLIALDTAGFAVSTGAACSSGSIEPSHVLMAIGRSVAEARSSMRFSFGRGNCQEDVDRLADAVICTVQRLRGSRVRREQLVTH